VFSSKIVVYVPMILLSAAVIVYGAAKGEKTTTTPEASVTVHLTPEGTDEGLRVVYPKQISAGSASPSKFPLLVINLLKDEVFLEVTGMDDLSYEIDVPGELVAGGGPIIVFPDNTHLLKRLHACSYHDGKACPCGCAMAPIAATINFDDVKLKDLVGSKMTIEVSLVGYYRASGKMFDKTTKLTVAIVK